MSARAMTDRLRVDVAGLRRCSADALADAFAEGCSPSERARLLGMSAAYENAAEIIEATLGGAR